MAISKDKKQAQVQALSEAFKTSKMTVLTSYKGLSVAEIQALRKQLKSAGGNYVVAKNSLISIAVKNVFKDLDTSGFTGPVALAFNTEDEVAPAQVVANLAKQYAPLEIIGGINAEGSLFTAEEVNRLATLPNKEQLRAQVVGTIAAPLSGFVNVMAGNLRGLINVINALQQDKAAS